MICYNGDDNQRGEASHQGDNVNVNAEMISALKKLQFDMELLRSENKTLKKELTTVKFNNKNKPKSTIRSVVRRLDTDEVVDEEQREVNDDDVLLVDKDGKVSIEK